MNTYELWVKEPGKGWRKAGYDNARTRAAAVRYFKAHEFYDYDRSTKVRAVLPSEAPPRNNPSRPTKAQKRANASRRSKQRRVAQALRKFLQAQNPSLAKRCGGVKM